ncbi:acyl-CoA dehydrogenase family protein [Pigmentiphaga aceris]|uniref:acyl-CoA dehydrogenase family protein n=1 Tax=Pigmentiphaga aceris TaxID=1940612 RepID=UPI001CA375FF|nr:acyl-CoA dehydrogenase family protein [Pigmentiphaga aceris]
MPLSLVLDSSRSDSRASSSVQSSAAPTTPSLQALLDRIVPVSAQIGEGESQREREREYPFAGFQLLRDSGLTGLRIPASLGGPGGSVQDVFDLLLTLAAKDPQVAHSLRSHFGFGEKLTLHRNPAELAEHVPRFLAGKIYAAGSTERGTPRPGILNTRLTREGDHFRLNGRKYYGTGSIYADYLYISANDENEQRVVVTVPATREGVSVVDDWDGMGQRLTASGTITVDNVKVWQAEIASGGSANLIGRYASSFRQLHLAAVAAGISQAVRDDAVAYVRSHARPIAHSHAETAGGDYFTQKVVGEIAAIARALPLLVRDAAAALDRSYQAIIDHADNADALVLESTLAVAQTQVLVAQLGPRAGELIFDIAGGSATGRAHNLDRHWRNIRTVISHNPTAYKAKATGDYLINGATELLSEGRFL